MKSIQFAVLTISDTRTKDNDESGQKLIGLIQSSQHEVITHQIVKDDRYQIRAQISQWVIDPAIDVIITTGGTGVTGRDGSPEAIAPLLDKELSGFGELFRMISYKEIGTAAIQSRALAGVLNGKYIFVLPGSKNAITTAWNEILMPQFTETTRPCNFVSLIPRLKE